MWSVFFGSYSRRKAQSTLCPIIKPKHSHNFPSKDHVCVRCAHSQRTRISISRQLAIVIFCTSNKSQIKRCHLAISSHAMPLICIVNQQNYMSTSYQKSSAFRIQNQNLLSEIHWQIESADCEYKLKNSISYCVEACACVRVYVGIGRVYASFDEALFIFQYSFLVVDVVFIQYRTFQVTIGMRWNAIFPAFNTFFPSLAREPYLGFEERQSSKCFISFLVCLARIKRQ